MANNEKRSTRSQSNISDYFSKVPLDLSPLKQARSAVRNADAIVATDSPGLDYSTGVTSGKKRSASPPTTDREENVERELKRSKTSPDESESHEPSPSSWKLQVFPSSGGPSALPPPSLSGSTTPTRNVGPSPRARSVPASIPTTPGRVPYLDLSKYRSPTKSAHRVRMMSVPPPSPPIRDREEGEEGVGRGKAVGMDLDKTPVPRMVIEKAEKVRGILDHPLPVLVVASTSGSRNDDPFSLEPDALPKTPTQKTRLLLESMSPLTPLGTLDPSSQPLPLTSPLPNNDVTADPMNLDPPAPSSQLKPQPQPRLQLPSESKSIPRPRPTKQSLHLIPPQPKPLSFRLPSRSPSPPSQWVPRPRSVSVDPPIPALPYPLVPSTPDASNGPPPEPEPEPEPVPPVAPTIPEPQPLEKHDPSEGIPPTITPMITPTTTEAVAPALVPPPVSDEKGKGKAEQQAPGPSKLPATKSTKASRLRSATVNAGPSGVTRTKATRVTARPTPMSREGRVTRSSTAKTRQADALKEREEGSTNLAAKPKGAGDGTRKDDTNAGMSIVYLTLVFGRGPDTRVSPLQRLHQHRLRRSHVSRWALLCLPPARRRSQDLPPQLNPSQPCMRSRLLENPVNLVHSPP